MNTKLVDSLIQVILSISKEERNLLEEKLFFESSSPSTGDLIQMAQKGGSFNFLYDEPDLYNQGRWGTHIMSVKKGDVV
ncbi:hypothetical protein [Coleofasciculus sp.]|uniref:hypothetical protein n=1 Tax=Coleofasciculus sp. TaxID=3100458 RepID=UPI0039F862A7